MLGGHPAGAFGTEAQAGSLQRVAGEDAVAGPEDGAEGGVGDFLRRAFKPFDGADAVDGDAAHLVAGQLPGEESSLAVPSSLMQRVAHASNFSTISAACARVIRCSGSSS